MASILEKKNDMNGNIKSDIKNDVMISFLRASRSGDLAKVNHLLDTRQITDINICNANGLNALHLAAKDGYLDIVKELLSRGISVNNATKKGNTALHIASLAGQKEVMKLLIQYNANVNVQSLNGFTPLYMAAQENHDECVRLLLNEGANPSLATEDGFTPLAVAMQQGNEKVVSVLLETDLRGKVRLPALHIAAKKNDVETAKLLLKNEKSPDVVSKSGFTPLHIAAHYGNVEIANLLIDEGADVNATAKHNITPMHVACKWGRKNIVLLLISRNANICAVTRDGLTPLHCAARSGHVEIIEVLLSNNAPLSIKTKNGLSALHMAAQGEHEQAARVLLHNNAQVDEVTMDFLTPLHVAAHCGHVKVAQTLLDFNANPNARALNGFTPLHIACKKNRIKMVELLMKNSADINAKTESGLTPLHVASFMGCINIVLYLLQNGADPNSIATRGETPLHLAVRTNQSDIVRILLRNKANVNLNAHAGQTPLHVAVRLDNSDIAQLLLQHGADLNATTKDNYTALHIAAKEGLPKQVSLLIDNGCDIDVETVKNFTPLHLACKYGKLEAVKILILNGSNVNALGKNDVTPLHVAAHYGRKGVVEHLLEAGASYEQSARNGHNALHIAVKKGNIDICEKLLQAGTNVNCQSKSGLTPLHIAVQDGNIDIVKLLLRHGANVNLPSKNGLTPLHLAAQEDRIAIATILLEHDAVISMQTKSGFTPLHVAAHYGQINIVKLLLERNADVDVCTKTGYTPLHNAAQEGHTLIINLLLRHKANPNATTDNGLTPLNLAQNLGCTMAIETLKVVTDIKEEIIIHEKKTEISTVKPEQMQESFFSDSEDDVEAVIDYQQYKYMANEVFKSSCEHDQKSFNTTEKGFEQTFGSELEKTILDSSLEKSQDSINGGRVHKIISNLGFLVSFLVDARGGSMCGARNSNVRVLVPPQSCAQPTRITCRFVKLEKVNNPPVLMEGEALVSRIIELSPANVNFLGPVILEFPHFGSVKNEEREIIVLRSDNGVTWSEHFDDETANAEMLYGFFEKECPTPTKSLSQKRIVKIITRKFPNFFAVVSRVKQEVHIIGPDGGTISSKAVPKVQAIFPQNALTKKIRVGLQAQTINVENNEKGHEQILAASPIVTIEPRRRKFHKAITLNIPAPFEKDGSGQECSDINTSNLRLLCSITAGQNRSIWEDVTGSTPLSLIKKSISFTTTVSARFWVLNCRHIADLSNLASKLYSNMNRVPYVAKFIVFAKRLNAMDIRFSVYCVSDEKDERALHQQKYFQEVARSSEVEVYENQEISFELDGNLKPDLKSEDGLQILFKPFYDNRKTFIAHIEDIDKPPVCRIHFLSTSKSSTSSVPNIKIGSLDVCLRDPVVDGIEEMKKLNFFEKDLKYKMSDNMEIENINDSATFESLQKADLYLEEFCELLGNDWIKLAQALNISSSDINLVCKEFADEPKKQALVIFRLWFIQNDKNIIGDLIQNALNDIGRDDIVDKCILNLKLVPSAPSEYINRNNDVNVVTGE